MRIVSDHGFPTSPEGNDGMALDALRSERNYHALVGRHQTTVAAMDWAIGEIERLRAALGVALDAIDGHFLDDCEDCRSAVAIIEAALAPPEQR